VTGEFQLSLHAANTNSQRTVFTINTPPSFLLWWFSVIGIQKKIDKSRQKHANEPILIALRFIPSSAPSIRSAPFPPPPFILTHAHSPYRITPCTHVFSTFPALSISRVRNKHNIRPKCLAPQKA